MLEPPRAVSVSGSDSSGCAGLQADLRTWRDLGVHGLSVVTAVTAQTGDTVSFIQAVSKDAIREQLSSALKVGFSAAKTGMWGDLETLQCFCSIWKESADCPLVVDPVRASSSGRTFLATEEARRLLEEELLPLASVVTPNIPEAEWLVQRDLSRDKEIEAAARQIQSWGVPTVIIKGGHGIDSREVRDLVVHVEEIRWMTSPRKETRHKRGTGCVLSAAIAAFLARGKDPLEAIVQAREYLQSGLGRGYPISGGPGPCMPL